MGHGRRSGRRGQSLVELALAIPWLILILLVAIDFGRVFLGWINLNSAARIAASYAAAHPVAAYGSAGDPVADRYVTLLTAETGSINCSVPSPLPVPAFTSGTAVGSPAQVSITCAFRLMTPMIGNLIGSPCPDSPGDRCVAVSASAAFPIRSGVIAGVPIGSTIPMPTATPTPSPTATTTAPAETPTPTPTPMCTVPVLVGMQSSQAQRLWTDAHFRSPVVFQPLTPPQYRIGTQSLTAGSSLACDSAAITVTP